MTPDASDVCCFTKTISNVNIYSPLGPADEMIVPGDIEGSSNMVSSSWSVEGDSDHSCLEPTYLAAECVVWDMSQHSRFYSK